MPARAGPVFKARLAGLGRLKHQALQIEPANHAARSLLGLVVSGAEISIFARFSCRHGIL